MNILFEISDIVHDVSQYSRGRGGGIMRGNCGRNTQRIRRMESWLLLSLLFLSSVCTYSGATELSTKVDETSVAYRFEREFYLVEYLRRLIEKESVYSFEKTEDAESSNSQKRTATGGVIRKVLVPWISQDFTPSFISIYTTLLSL